MLGADLEYVLIPDVCEEVNHSGCIASGVKHGDEFVTEHGDVAILDVGGFAVGESVLEVLFAW